MPFNPICIFCLADCDAEGKLSSCHHFFCSRCVQRMTADPGFGTSCPICQKPYQFSCLKSNTIQPLFRDAGTTLQYSTKLVCNQIFHYQQVIARLRAVLRALHGKLQVLETQIRQKDQALMRALEENKRQQQSFSMNQTCSSCFAQNNSQPMMTVQHASMGTMPQGPPTPPVSMTPRLSNFQVRKPSDEGSLKGFEYHRNSHPTSLTSGWEARAPGGESQPSEELRPLGWAESSHCLKRHRGGVQSTLGASPANAVCQKNTPSERYPMSSSPHALLTPNSCSNALSFQKAPPFRLSTPFANPAAFGDTRGQHVPPHHGVSGNGAPKLLQGLLSGTP
ncbi:unnamed protein product [Phytomonas sp. EM1]|nr:unnamed protein product [Phytomonas sp. EM1]|eukprot:CCW61910.1 unnamed protein product [Phytomonas sp. isolate EM1]